MEIVKSDLQLLARKIEPYSNELTPLQELKTEFMSGTVRYDTTCKEYLDFLSRTNTAEGVDEVHKLSGEMQDLTHFVETEGRRMNTIINELRAIERESSLASRSSRRSNSSRKTHSSSSSSALARARAKAEAAKQQISSIHIDKENTNSIHIDKENTHSTHVDQENPHVSRTLDPHANSFIPMENVSADTHVSDNHPYPSDRTLATDFTRFLLNSDLLMSSQQANTGFKDKLPTTKGKLNDVRSRKTDFAETKNERSQSVDLCKKCLIHGTNHTLNVCRTFKSKPIQEQPSDYDEENKVKTPIQSACTQICMDKFGGKSCAMIMSVEVYLSDNPDRRLKVYALMDDQSNRTLGKSELFDYFGSTSVSDFILSTCSGKSQASGRKLSGLIVESLDKQTQLHVPDI
ncbi:unnamed protein product [Mytilus edulis]|uniref:Uncharacterized protein n=1 Tax=Mytilus edulis TaxID=6550 RepID=A0A8S3UMY6_MYTED|nr:unnamed protein product [Mytilus edulis]